MRSLTSSTGAALHLGDRRADERQYAGSFGRPRCGTGARNGLSVSTSRRSSGHRAAASRTSAAFLNVTMPLNETNMPSAQATLDLVGTAGEAVQHRPLGHALRREHVEQVVPRVAGVDDERQVVRVRQRHLVGERDAARPRCECS